jgi:hypothetical protein
MQDRSTPARWLKVIACAGILAAAPLFAWSATDTTPPESTEVSYRTAAGGDGTQQTPLRPQLFERTVAWWPYVSGPYYGDLPRDEFNDEDAVHTVVGSFKIGQSLPIPSELTGSLDAIALGRSQYFMVKLRGEDPGQSRDVLVSLGARVMEEFGVNGLILRLDPAAYDMVASSPAITWIEPYHPAFRIHPSIGRVPQLTVQAAASPMFRLSLDLFPGEPLEPTAELVRQIGGTVLDGHRPPSGTGELIVEINASLIPQLAQIESVALITEDMPVFPMGDGALFVQSENGSIGDFPYWRAGVDGSNEIIHVQDSGLSVDAGDFTHRRSSSGWSSGAACKVVDGHRKIRCYTRANDFGGNGDFSACDSASSGAFTHGQLVSGCAAGNATRGTVPAGDAPNPLDDSAEWGGDGFYLDENDNGLYDEGLDLAYDGVAKGARVVFVDADTDCPDALDPGLSPGNLETSIKQTWASYDATIHNFSFGSLAPETGPLYSEARPIDEAVYDEPISVVMESAGNEGDFGDDRFTIGNIGNEASCKNCIPVGASDGPPGGGDHWSITSHGPAQFDRVSPLLFAEGRDYSCRSEDGAGVEDQTGVATCLTAGPSLGTSFAAPNMAGAAALVRDFFAKGFYPDGTDTNPANGDDLVDTISAALVKAILITSAQPITTGRNLVPEDRFNSFWGYGAVLLPASLPLADEPDSVTGLIVHDLPGDIDKVSGNDGVSSLSLPATIGTSSGETYSDEFDVLSDEEDLVVALVWNDPPNSTGEVTNDLDLELRYCGDNDTCGDGDDTIWHGNIFSEDYDRDETEEFTVLDDGQIDGWHYTIDNNSVLSGQSYDTVWDTANNTEAVFVPSDLNAPDRNGDGTPDVAPVVPGRYRISVIRSSGSTTLPYAVAIAGPVAAGSSVRFDQNPVTCNGDVAVIVNEKADPADPSCPDGDNCPASVINSRTSVRVLDTNGAEVDSITDLSFTSGASGLRFQSQLLPVSTVTQPDPTDGILSVGHEYTLEALYADSSADRTSRARIDCQPELNVSLIPQQGLDSPFFLGGGCDDDDYLDVNEEFSFLIQFFNIDRIDIIDAETKLRAVVPDGDNATDPCRENNATHGNVTIEQPTRVIGQLPAQTIQRTSFVLGVEGTPAARDRVEFVFSLSGGKVGQPIADCVAFEMLLQADEETNYYLTDCPTGCTLDFDINADEELDERIPDNPFDPLNFLNRGQDEIDIVYGDMTSTVGRTETDCPDCGNPGFEGLWDFDQSDNGFRTGVTPLSEGSDTTAFATNWGEDSNWDNVLQAAFEDEDNDGVLDQNWGVTGGCGWMTSDGTNRGIWHTGDIGTWQSSHATEKCRPNDSICEEYDVLLGTTGQGYWMETLRSPAIHPVRFGEDQGDGFSWTTQIVNWEWNFQFDLADGFAGWVYEFDLDTESDSPNVMGDDFFPGSNFYSNSFGLISGGQISIFGGAMAFAPTDDDPNSPNYGDGKNGEIGNNREGQRGCYFNDLGDIDTGDGLTAAERPVNSPPPIDDDCDNEFDLGPDQCPGNCGVDDDGDGNVDEADEICPCRVCDGGPRADQFCRTSLQCNVSITTNYVCVSNTNATGQPVTPASWPDNDDVCGDGQTDETLSAEFGDNTTLRQRRNAELSMVNGVGGVGRGGGDPRFYTLEDIYGPAGTTWQTEVAFYVQEPEGDEAPGQSYGLGIDDMVIEWKEFHPVDQSGDSCDPGANPDFQGQCARVSLGVAFNTNDGDGEVPVSVKDFNAATTENAVDCNGDGNTNEVEVQAYSEAERIPETFCLERSGPGSSEYVGSVRTTTRIRKENDGLVYLAFNANDTPSITVRYFDKNDGVNGFGPGDDGQPGVAGFDDDGDGVTDNDTELCPTESSLAPGRTPHEPGTAARYSDDDCGCLTNPVQASTFAAFDVADLIVAGYTVDDSSGDGDGWPDPGEEVTLDLYVRNLSNFPLENIELLIASESPLVDCVTDDRLVISRLEARGNAGDDFDTANGSDHFSFIAAADIARTSVGEDFGSDWSLAMRALAKAEGDAQDRFGSALEVDIPISGTYLAQHFRIQHNLDATGTSPIADYTNTFESYTTDDEMLADFVPHVTGDDAAELDGTRCQTNDPANPFGNNTERVDFCELGEGYDNSEHHWHLHAPAAPPGGTVCEQEFCPDGGRSMPGGTKSMSNSNTLEIYGGPLDDQNTMDLNRMNWVETANNFQLGLGEPELRYWTQMSLTDSRIFGGGPIRPASNFAFDAALTYICVDGNNNNECDTLETGLQDGSENWEPLRAYYSPPTVFRQNNFINCMYEPSDDGNNEDDFFPNALDTGPSSTCFPGNPVNTCVGRTRDEATGFGVFANVLGSLCWPETGQESEGTIGFNEGTWVEKRFDLSPWRGKKVLVRWHLSPGGLPGIENFGYTPAVGNRDDGWFIDDITITGLVSDFDATVDNAGGANPICGTQALCTTVDTKVAVLPYPRNDKNGEPKQALACSSNSSTSDCDFDSDGNRDTNETEANTGAPGHSVFLDASFTDTDKCLGGSLEWRFLNADTGVVVRDWLTDPLALVQVEESTTFTVESRCTSDLGCIDSQDMPVNVPGGPCIPLDLLFSDKTTLVWDPPTNDACAAIFDTLRGNVGTWGSGTCIENDGTDFTTTDTAEPALAAGFWYLTRVDGETWDSTNTDKQEDRSGITGCP